jgi:hypothetical protein
VLVAAIPDRGRGRAGLLHHLFDGRVDLAGGRARNDHGRDPVEDIGRDPPRGMHAGEILGLVDADAVLGQGAFEVVQSLSPGGRPRCHAKLRSLRGDFQSALP